MKKTTTEVLHEWDKDKKRIKELKKIREERKNLNEVKKPQRRKVEIIEYEDGTYSLKGYAYNLPLKANEVEPAFKAWLDNSLKEGITLNEKSKGR